MKKLIYIATFLTHTIVHCQDFKVKLGKTASDSLGFKKGETDKKFSVEIAPEKIFIAASGAEKYIVKHKGKQVGEFTAAGVDKLIEITSTFDLDKPIQIFDKKDDSKVFAQFSFVSDASKKKDAPDGKKADFAASCDKSFLPTTPRKGLSGFVPSSGSFVFDYAINQLRFPIGENRFSPMVDRQYSIAAINYNPYRDSLGIAIDFEDRNMEYGEKFLGFLNPSSSSGTTPEDTNPKVDPKAGGDGTDLKECLEKLAKDLEIYYNTNLASASINADDLATEITEKEANIKSIFGISNIETELKAKGDAAQYEIAIKYYRLIKNYRRIGFMPFQIKNMDVTKLTLTAYRNRQSVGTSSFEFLNKGGFKIDFSLGFMGTGLVNYKYITQTLNLADTTYKLGKEGIVMEDKKAVIDTVRFLNKNKILRSNEGDFRFGMALLSHAYIRTGERLNVGLTTGFMLDNNINAAYLLGGSVMLGSERRWVLSGGWAVGKVKRLEDGLSEGKIIPIVSGQSNNGIVMKDQSNNSWFFSVTYNLGGTTIGKQSK